MSNIFLTGITSSGTPHLGNYIGAIKPALDRQHNGTGIFFIADLHSLVKLWDAPLRKQYVLEIAATWLALGLDPEKTLFYRQSDIIEIPQLAWVLSTVASKGLLNRSHAYKALAAENEAHEGTDPDKGITMGLFSYPVLMAADILIFNAHKIPVGKDQVQHIEIARDLAARFNHLYGETFILPEAVVDEDTAVLPGLDGRKMSKSYGNTIPLFESPKKMQKMINKIVTNSLEPHEPKDPDNCTLFDIYRAFANEDELNFIRERYQSGIGWGEMKKILGEKIIKSIGEAREQYEFLINNPNEVENILADGAHKARKISTALLQDVYEKVGL